MGSKPESIAEALKSVPLNAIPVKQAIFINPAIDQTVEKQLVGTEEISQNISDTSQLIFEAEGQDNWMDLQRSYFEFDVQVEKEKPTDPDLDYKKFGCINNTVHSLISDIGIYI